jgi:hypothetical protein
MPGPGGRAASRRSAPQRCEEGTRIAGRPGGQDVSSTRALSRRIGTCRRCNLGKIFGRPKRAEREAGCGNRRSGAG